jgi:hypothetical protein
MVSMAWVGGAPAVFCAVGVCCAAAGTAKHNATQVAGTDTLAISVAAEQRR